MNIENQMVVGNDEPEFVGKPQDKCEWCKCKVYSVEQVEYCLVGEPEDAPTHEKELCEHCIKTLTTNHTIILI